MTKTSPNSFTVGRGTVASWEADVLVQVAANYVPTLLHRLDVYKLEFPYDNPQDWETGVRFVNAQQEAFLMDIGERIINEVRATRDGAFTPAEARDPLIDPYTLPLTSLRTIAASVDDTNADISAILATTNQTLSDILAAVQAQGGGQDVLDRLDTLIFLLGAL